MNTETPSGIDGKAFEILVREHHRRLLAYTLSLVQQESVAEDLVQEALLIAYSKLRTFDAAASFPAWVRGIIRNLYYVHCRKYREIPCPDEELEQLSAVHEQWDHCENANQTLFQALSRCMHKLPDTMRRVVEGFYMERMPQAEVAVELCCQEVTVRKRLERARKSLGCCIQGLINNPGDEGWRE